MNLTKILFASAVLSTSAFAAAPKHPATPEEQLKQQQQQEQAHKDAAGTGAETQSSDNK